MMLPEERREMILSLVMQQGIVRVDDLSHKLEASLSTIRRDLAMLEQQAAIRRVHGGAMVMPVGRLLLSPSRHVDNAAEKARIAEKALDFIHDRDTIILDGGTTTYEIAARLVGRPLTVITPSIPISLALADRPGITVILTGGILLPGTRSLGGAISRQVFEFLHADRLFLGVLGIHPDRGLVYSSAELAELKQAAVRAAEQVIVVCDHSKFGRVGASPVIPIRDVDAVITDRGADSRMVDRLKEQGIAVHVV
ncbi:MAG: DeoR/GlpR family DNA-binding transcription regulator [Armatimonadota bacterium]|nr:DeoR/GlpR family DNA-binding transcription regulator [Armatimonadota bacterium]MDR7500389.1 DeoR/GlpR family DNA-binding transcription regulator [Armatimonadota bacterium]MDR7548047.1 DeoR/GlpR family DNA-binding transcription regulator [Armatimonadota bacterium]